MRKIFVIVVVLLCVSACEAGEKFVEFPTVGVCTGSYVRYRAEPNTEADIWGRLQTDDKIIVDGQTAVNGEIWYEILPPNAQETAFIYGKYLVPFYDEETQGSQIGKLIIQVLERYAPHKENDYYEEYADATDSPEVKRRYNNKGWLVRVEAWNKGSDFGDIHIGDSVRKLEETLGKPDDNSGSEWTYTAGKYAAFTFRIKDGKITRMIYEE